MQRSRNELRLEEINRILETKEVKDIPLLNQTLIEEKEKLEKKVKKMKLNDVYEKLLDEVTLEEILEQDITSHYSVEELTPDRNYLVEISKKYPLRPGEKLRPGEAFPKPSPQQIFEIMKKLAKYYSILYPFLTEKGYTKECINLKIIQRGEDSARGDYNLWKLNRDGLRALIRYIEDGYNQQSCCYHSQFTMVYDSKLQIPKAIKTANAKWTSHFFLDYDKISYADYKRQKKILESIDVFPTIEKYSGYGYQQQFVLGLGETLDYKEGYHKLFVYTAAKKGLKVDLDTVLATQQERNPFSYNCKSYSSNKLKDLYKSGIEARVQPVPVAIINYSGIEYEGNYLLEQLETLPDCDYRQLSKIHGEDKANRIIRFFKEQDSIEKTQLVFDDIDKTNERLNIVVDSKLQEEFQKLKEEHEEQEEIVNKIHEVLRTIGKNTSDPETAKLINKLFPSKKEKEKREIAQAIKTGKPFNNEIKSPKTFSEINKIGETKSPLSRVEMEELKVAYRHINELMIDKLPRAIQRALYNTPSGRWNTFSALVPFFKNSYFEYQYKINSSSPEEIDSIKKNLITEIMSIWNRRCGKFRGDKDVAQQVDTWYEKLKIKNHGLGDWEKIKDIHGNLVIPSRTIVEIDRTGEIPIVNPLIKKFETFGKAEAIKIYIYMYIAYRKELLMEWTMNDLIDVFNLKRKAIDSNMKLLAGAGVITIKRKKGNKNYYSIIDFDDKELKSLGFTLYRIAELEILFNKLETAAQYATYFCMRYFTDIKGSRDKWSGYHEEIGQYIGFDESTISRVTSELHKLQVLKKDTFYQYNDKTPYKCTYKLYY